MRTFIFSALFVLSTLKAGPIYAELVCPRYSGTYGRYYAKDFIFQAKVTSWSKDLVEFEVLKSYAGDVPNQVRMVMHKYFSDNEVYFEEVKLGKTYLFSIASTELDGDVLKMVYCDTPKEISKVVDIIKCLDSGGLKKNRKKRKKQKTSTSRPSLIE